MLDRVRKYTGSWGVKVLYFLIAVSFFIGFGILSSLRSCIEGGGGVVAVVDGETISSRKFLTNYYRQIQNITKEAGEKLSQEKISKIKDYVVNVLINRTLLKHYAREAGITVSDREVADYIATKFKFLNPDGTFDKRRYLLVLRDNKLYPDEFEEEIREELFLQKLDKFLLASLVPTDAELWLFFKRETEMVNLGFVVFKPENFRKYIRVRTRELKRFFDSHIEKYKYPQRLVVKYISFKANSYKDQVKVNEKELRKYYEDNYSNYQEAFINVKEKVKEDLIKEKGSKIAYNDAVKARTLLTQGRTIDEVAKEFNLQIHYTTPFKIPPENEIPGIKEPEFFAEKFKGLKEGETAPLFQIEGNYFVGMLDHIVPEEIASFDEVKDKVKKDYIESKSGEVAKKTADGFIKYSRKYGLKRALRKFGLPAKETGEFSVDTMTIPGIGASKEIFKRAFEIEKKGYVDISSYKVSSNYYVIWLKERKNANRIEFEKKKVEYRKKLLDFKLNVVHMTLLTQLRQKLQFRIYFDVLQKIS